MNKSRRPTPMSSKPYDEIYTPHLAIKPLLPFLDKNAVIWECAYGGGDMARALESEGFTVIGRKDMDFFTEEPENYDIIVTNPPYSLKDEFLKRAYELGKPFAFLLPLTTLEGKRRGELFRKYGVQLIIPNKRINFTGGKSGCWFQTSWFVWKFGLEKDLNFVDLDE